MFYANSAKFPEMKTTTTKWPRWPYIIASKQEKKMTAGQGQGQGQSAKVKVKVFL